MRVSSRQLKPRSKFVRQARLVLGCRVCGTVWARFLTMVVAQTDRR